MKTNQAALANEEKERMTREIYERIATLDNIVVMHPPLKEALDGLLQCIAWSNSSREPFGAVLVGTGGMGKTTICNAILKRYPPKVITTDFEIIHTVPAFYSSVPSPSTIKSLAANLLESLGDKFPCKGNANSLTTRLCKLLKISQTKIILLDEFHHLLSEGSVSEKRTNRICNWLKSLINHTGVMICLVGIPSCEALVNYDSQMSRRFMHRYRLTLLDAGAASKPGPLGGFLRTLSKKYVEQLCLDGMVDFKDHHHIQQVWAATSGNPAFVSTLIRKAIAAAKIGGRNMVAVSDFASAFDTGLTSSVAKIHDNPFNLSSNELAKKLDRIKLNGGSSC